MRILSVVTLISPDGAYGGPVRVALNQAAALTELGHQVTLAAAVRGYDQIPDQIDGVDVRLFPARTALPGTGFAGLSAPTMLGWLREELARTDVAHVHLARDLVTLPAAREIRRAGRPYFVQPHGMIDPSRNPLAPALDLVLTKPLLRNAAGVFHLTDHERRGLVAVAGELRFASLPNGVPFADDPGTPAEVEVLYLARLAPRKRPLAFVEAATALAPAHSGVRFRLVGPDEGEGAKVSAAIDDAHARGVDIAWEGALPPQESISRLSRATIYVLPSVDEPYPMSVLEALSVARPVVITDTCGLAGFVTRHEAGRVVDAEVSSLTQAIGELLDDPQRARAAGQQGRAAVRDELGMPAIAAQLAAHYQAAVSA